MLAAIEVLSTPLGSQLLNFGAMAAAMLIAVSAAFYWVTTHQRKRKRKRKHHGHGRINPTRAEVGGMPPPRSETEADNRSDAHSPFDP